MERLLDVCRSLQTLVIDQVSGMIWPKNDELFFQTHFIFSIIPLEQKKLSSRTLWNVLLRTARFWPMERLLDVWRSLQTLVIDQVSGMI
jgi:hypothetical protein